MAIPVWMVKQHNLIIAERDALLKENEELKKIMKEVDIMSAMSINLVGKYVKLRVSALSELEELTGEKSWGYIGFIECFDEEYGIYTVFVNKLDGSKGFQFPLKRGEFVTCK